MVENTVFKIGGSCLVEEADFGRVADFLIESAQGADFPVTVVVSAMQGETDRLTEEAETLFGGDVLAQVEHIARNGEFVSVRMLCDTLMDRGVRAVMVDPWMLDMRAQSDGDPFTARLLGMDAERVEQYIFWSNADFVIVPGYVGIDESVVRNDKPALVALGRGASDLIAVEAAKQIGGRVRLVKSAGSITTVDAGLVTNPKAISHMSPEMALRMLEYMRPRDQFIQSEAVRLARRHGVVIEFGSMDTPRVVSRVDPAFRSGEQDDFRALPIRDDIVRLSIVLNKDDPEAVFAALAYSDSCLSPVPFSDGGISWTPEGRRFSVHVDAADANEAMGRLTRFSDGNISTQRGTLLTLIDSSIRPQGQHFLRAYSALAGLAVHEVRSSGVIFHFLVDDADAEAAANALAEEFELIQE